MNLPNKTGKFSQNTKLVELLDELRYTLNLYAALIEAKENAKHHFSFFTTLSALPLDISNDLSNQSLDVISENLTTRIEQQIEKAISIIDQVGEIL